MNTLTIDFKYDVGDEVWFDFGGEDGIKNGKIDHIKICLLIDESTDVGQVLPNDTVRYYIRGYDYDESELSSTREELISSL